jgi:hypothetical protein
VCCGGRQDVVPGLASWFQLVEIPEALRMRLLAGAVLDLVLCYGIERITRWAFPAPRPPPKGYMLLMGKRARLSAAMRAAEDKKDK